MVNITYLPHIPTMHLYRFTLPICPLSPPCGKLGMTLAQYTIHHRPARECVIIATWLMVVDMWLEIAMLKDCVSDGASWRTVNGRRLGSDARARHDHSVL